MKFLVFFCRTVGVASFLKCSRCDAHIGLLTQDDGTGEIQYYANGIAMTFSPKNEQPPKQKEIPNELSKKLTSKKKSQPILSELTMEQIAATRKNLITNNPLT